MSQTTEVRDNAATANSTMTRDANADSGARRFALTALSGGLDNLGYERGGVTSSAATVTINPDASPAVSAALYEINATGGARTVNLPAAATWPGMVIEIQKTDTSANAVTVDGNASETINGATTQILYFQYETIRIRSNGTGWDIISWYAGVSGPLTNAIADPGNAGAIPITRSGYVDLVSAGAETRTLAAPSAKGQTLLLNFKTDGGDCVVTCATTVNQSANNTITFNDAGDAVLLVAKTSGSNIRWSVVSNDGASLSTV